MYWLHGLWPQADRRSRPDPVRARRRRRRRKLIDIAAAVGVVVVGLSMIAAIVIASPRWQRIIASWRETIAVHSPSVPQLIETAVAPMRTPAVNRGALPGELPATRPSRVPALPSLDLSASRFQSDSAQVMAGLLVSQLGQDPAWQTALANSEAQPPDSPEQAFWRAVASAIRDSSGQRAPVTSRGSAPGR
jgi:hypothetical protein